MKSQSHEYLNSCDEKPEQQHGDSSSAELSKRASTEASGTARQRCELCPRRCLLREGDAGFCGVRGLRGGQIRPLFYAMLSSLALDPIEKKPLYHFFPGTSILSVGSFGCNMACPFCQNYEISREWKSTRHGRKVLPAELVEWALRLRNQGNIGIAFTYNEPLISFEYVRDSARAARQAGLKTVMVSNGQILAEPLEELLPLMDAWNMDLKAFHEEGYRRLGGDLATTLASVEAVFHSGAHLEITSLIVPGLNDDLADMRRQAQWLAQFSSEIPLHLSRCFPRWRQKQGQATPIPLLEELAAEAKTALRRVYLGNV